MVGVGELERQGVRSGLELHRRLLLRLTVVQVRGVEGDRLTLLDVATVHHDVMVSRTLLETISGGRNLTIGYVLRFVFLSTLFIHSQAPIDSSNERCGFWLSRLSFPR